ncbi:hypothetical protein P171DRAFT_375833 [Karstenula rhodostoma CBS 690.94]|uniref:VPS9 domain-containing protein n=1 Tax=Karstenula rhodostoma CBS 690.94 TaxID=1392251 RepID=A0A9P4PZ62_9PLEO|nr:hypothetical protein P171DRAFT_375833 [Karstenula rhodostoma CBS 690.94]
MSSTDQTPHLDEAPESSREQQLGENPTQGRNGASLPASTEIEEPNAPTNEEQVKKEDSNDAGQAPAPAPGDAGVIEGPSKEDIEKESEEAKPDTKPAKAPADTAGTDAEPQPGAPEKAPAAPSSDKPDEVPRASTPPPESEKAAGKAPVRSPSPPPPPPKDDRYLSTSNVPSRTTSPISQPSLSRRTSEDADAAAYAAKHDGTEDAVDDSQSEIQSIMDQFADGHGGPGEEEIMSPRLEIAQPMLDAPITHPPRHSSLVSTDKPLPIPNDVPSPEQPLKSPPLRTSSLYRVGTNNSLNEVSSPSAHAPSFQAPAPPPDPEPDLPFDFHRFLEQLRHRTADPVAKFLRSFLLEFAKKQWMVHEQVKIIGDFLEFISKKMAQCEVWRTVSDAEFDNAREGMEKLVMNRLYSQTFSPAIPPPEPVGPSRSRRRQEGPGPGRRGQHQEDVERDEVLAQKVRIYGWVGEEHLDIQPIGDKGKKFLHLAQQELLKIKSYRAPRDKVICILNCCKVIFGYLRTATKADQSADAFVPLLIYTVLHANPDHLVSNVQYILRFRNQDKLGGEAGYYISSLMGAIQFIEGLDKTSLTVTDEEFEKNVEAAVSAIAERHNAETTMPDPTENPPHMRPPPTHGHRRMPSPHSLHLSEKSKPSRPEVTTRNSLDAEQAGTRRSTSTRTSKNESDPPEEENAAVAGLLRTIQRPLSTIGRIFSDNDTTTSSGPASTPQPGNTPRLTPQPPQLPPRGSANYPGHAPPEQFNEKQRRSAEEERYRQRLSAEDAAARQASAEAEEARRIQRKEHSVVVETLAGMFPQLDRDVIDDVVRMKEGRVGLAVDACLALGNP